MASTAGPIELFTAVRRTWGASGLARRSAYEVQKRSGGLRWREDRWPEVPAGGRLARIGLAPPPGAVDPGPLGSLRLYGSVDVGPPVPSDWHVHPLTGHRWDPTVHWSELSDHDPEHGDVKDLWERSRMGWLQHDLRRWAATGDDAIAAGIWIVLEDWYRANPRFLGPNWMCGQETSLRAIGTMVVADALDPSAVTTDVHRALVAQMVHDAVGRVAPTLGYAQSQRNNHATSEAGFLWGAAVLAPWLPGAAGLARRAGAALAEAVEDQFATDGSYAQHSPTYQRVALHVLLWCAAIARATGATLPDGVLEAVARSVVHLGDLMVPGSGGRMPNLGGNDGALVLELAPGGVSDFRPVLAHAAAATGQAHRFGPGSWDQEAAWFGLSPGSGPPAVPAPSRSTHALTRGSAHAVLRAGALDHRPSHADQLHVDVWLDGRPVAVDAGSYRYTAPAPWGNALADERVHNLPQRAGAPQAVRSGRFFWRSWREAELLERVELPDAVAQSARLDLGDGTVVHRTVLVAPDLVVVADRATAEVVVRWNLAGDPAVHIGPDRVDVIGDGAGGSGVVGTILAAGAATVLVADDRDPASGWEAPTYGERNPLRAVLAGSGSSGSVVSAFAVGRPIAAVAAVAGEARGLAGDRLDAAAVSAVVAVLADAR